MKNYLFLLSFFYCLVASGQNQTDIQNKVWTLEECIDYALNHNLTIKRAILNQSNAEVDYMRSKSQRLPDLSLSFGERVAYGSSIDPITSDFISQTVHSTSVNMNSQISLYSGNQITNQIKQSEMLLQQNSLFVEEAKNNITLNIIEAYLQLLYNYEGILVAENNLEASIKEFESAKGRYEIGSIDFRNLADAESQASTNQYNLVEAKNNYEIQVLSLKQFLELKPAQEFEIEIPDTEYNGVWIVPDKMIIYQKALDFLPEINASKLQIEINEKDLDIAKGKYYPTLSLSGGVSSGYTSSQDLQFSNQLTSNFSPQLGLSLNIPIFNRNQTKAAVQNAKISIEVAELQVSTYEKDLFKKIETAWQNSVSSQSQIVASEVARNSAKASYELSQKQYELGSLNTTDLVISQNRYTNAEQNYLQAKYLAIMYRFLIEFYQGEDLKLSNLN